MRKKKKIDHELDPVTGKYFFPHHDKNILRKSSSNKNAINNKSEELNFKTPSFATIDIETQDWVNYVTGAIYWFDKDGNEQYYQDDDPMGLMLKCFQIRVEDDVEDFVAHYGGKFDFLFFIETLFPKDDFLIEKIIPRGSSILSFTTSILKIGDTWKYPFPFIKKKNSITFRDSSALLAYALGTLTKSFNVETKKGDMDFLFIEKAYKGIDYIDDILTHPFCTTFWKGKQITSYTSNMRIKSQRHNIGYWNAERNQLVKYAPTTEDKYPYESMFYIRCDRDKAPTDSQKKRACDSYKKKSFVGIGINQKKI